ncbi:MAG: DUF1080 domain-containing protein [Verrucomicrobiae bacterium]|nr:DUF1080 domain-containing protein [Verrucomicrobiae bacterium]
MKLWNYFSAAAALPFLLVAPITCPAQDAAAGYPPPSNRENSVTLFNGKDFSGFAFCMKDNADPLQTWSVTNGVIHCTGKPIGYVRTTQVYSNYFLTVEWRFVKVAPKADNTGILVHIQPPDKVWPMCIQVQGKHTRQGDLFVMAGAECKEHKGQDANTPVPYRKEFIDQPAELPVGEWNRSETICLHGKVSTFLNGKFVNEITECTIDSGYIGIQSEGGDIEIRSLVFAPLKF